MTILKNLSLVVTIMFLQACSPFSTLKTVKEVNLKSYAGAWHQIAAIPAWFQKDCTSDTTAEYELTAENEIKVTNKCIKKNGSFEIAQGLGRINPKYGENSKLEVTFVNLFGFWVWWFGGDYWIMDLASDYSYSIVGDPDLKYLWILSRNPILSLETLKILKSKIENQNYDTCKIIITQPNELNKKPLCEL